MAAQEGHHLIYIFERSLGLPYWKSTGIGSKKAAGRSFGIIQGLGTKDVMVEVVRSGAALAIPWRDCP